MSLSLSIDTANFDQAKLEIKDNEGNIIKEKTFSSGRELAEKLVPEIDALIGQDSDLKEKITDIYVHNGPGSFTSTRIGVAVANSIAFGLNARINGNRYQFASPVYEKPANITLSKKLTSELDKRVQ